VPKSGFLIGFYKTGFIYFALINIKAIFGQNTGAALNNCTYIVFYQ